MVERGGLQARVISTWQRDTYQVVIRNPVSINHVQRHGIDRQRQDRQVVGLQAQGYYLRSRIRSDTETLVKGGNYEAQQTATAQNHAAMRTDHREAGGMCNQLRS